MKTKNPILTIALVIAGILLLWYFFGKGCAGPSYEREYREVLAINSQILREDLIYQSQRDSMFLVTVRQEETIDSLRKAKSTVHKEYVVIEKKVKDLITGHDNLISTNDSSGYYANCDSLAREAERLLEISRIRENINQNIVTEYEFLVETKDSLIENHARQQAELLAAFSNVTGKYDTLYKDYKKVNRNVKVQRTIGRVLAGAVLVLGGILISK